jgi:hypothetical protein
VQAATGINYFVSWLAFGDLTLHESMHSLDLYAKHVMPAFRDNAPPSGNDGAPSGNEGAPSGSDGAPSGSDGAPSSASSRA